MSADDADGAELTHEQNGEQLLVASETEGVTASAALDADADPEEIDAALEALRSELHHSRRVAGGGGMDG